MRSPSALEASAALLVDRGKCATRFLHTSGDSGDSYLVSFCPSDYMSEPLFSFLAEYFQKNSFTDNYNGLLSLSH